MESELHQKKVKEEIQRLESQGYRVIDTERKCPDAIAVKDGKIFAVEILPRRYKKGRGWNCKWSLRAKKINYKMYDDIFFAFYKRNADGTEYTELKN